jgi:hypothetical protein
VLTLSRTRLRSDSDFADLPEREHSFADFAALILLSPNFLRADSRELARISSIAGVLISNTISHAACIAHYNFIERDVRVLYPYRANSLYINLAFFTYGQTPATYITNF